MSYQGQRKALVLLSGGQDSTTCLFYAKERAKQAGYGDEIHALTINYGQRHAAELESARRIAGLAGVKTYRVVDVGGEVLVGTSPLLPRGGALEMYASANVLPGGIEKTFVPGRNMLFAVIAANHAMAMGAPVDIYLGVSQEDYGGYPDCREIFIDVLEDAMNLGMFGEESGGSARLVPSLLRFCTPLIHRTKADTVNMAVALGSSCMEALAHSHTCYAGSVPPCGHCHACLLRAKGFREAGVPDPLIERLANTTAHGALRG